MRKSEPDWIALKWCSAVRVTIGGLQKTGSYCRDWNRVNSLQSNQLTQLLHDWSRGNEAALNQLTPLVYDELRKLANSYIRRERPGHTLNGTALVHEAYLRLVGGDTPHWEGRSHFYGVAARLMRQILVDHARRRAAARRNLIRQSHRVNQSPSRMNRRQNCSLWTRL